MASFSAARLKSSPISSQSSRIPKARHGTRGNAKGHEFEEAVGQQAGAVGHLLYPNTFLPPAPLSFPIPGIALQPFKAYSLGLYVSSARIIRLTLEPEYEKMY